MNYFKYLLSFLMIFSLSISMNSQNDTSVDEISINQVLITIFDGMREGDSTKVRSVFRDDIRMFTSYKTKTGKAVLKEDKLFSFLKAVGTAHKEVWDEKIWNTKIQVDGNIAQVWTDYAFYVDEKFSHCGIDAFQLVKENDTWKIISLMDTRRKDDCK